MAKFDKTSITLAAALGASAPLAVPYPAGRAAKDYIGGTDHQIHTNSYRPLYAANGDFTLAFGASTITLTNTSNVAMAPGTVVYLHLDKAEADDTDTQIADPSRVTEVSLFVVSFGAPIAASATAIAASQAATVASGLATGINGTQAVGGVVALAAPRNIVAAWTGAAVLTVIGEDQFGKPMRESSASGTSFTGKKAFMKVTGITVSANVTALTVGTGVVLGLPLFLAEALDVRLEKVAGAVPGTAGTLVAGDTAVATATTGDVRGTYAPNTAPNGTNTYDLLVVARSGNGAGVPQFAG
jgi:hypothetical protein